jgi:acetolactate synthase-1/2/3 large subunit
MARTTGGEALVAALTAHGVDTVFGIPGTHNLAAYAALARHGVRHVSARHEQGAAFAADGYSRASGRVGVCLTTTGPAILNAATAAAQAYSDSIPVLLVSPGMPLAHPGRGNGHLHEVKDQRAALDAVVAYSHRVTSVPEISLAVAQAFVAMASGRPRPVHLEIPLDLLDAEGEATTVAPLTAGRVVPAPGPLREATRLLATADRPLVLAGGGARGAAAELLRLARRLGAPVITTANGKGVVPEDDPLSLGAGLQHPSVLALVEDSDVVLAVGTELAPADLWLGPLRVPGRLVRVDIDATSIATNAVPEVAVVSDAAAALSALLEGLGGTPPGGNGHERAAHWRARIRAEARAEGGPWLEIVDALAAALGRDAVVAGDSAMACYYGALSNLPLHRPGSFLYPAGLGTLGYGLPAAIGAKLARPEADVLALLGDGGVMFTIAELAAAAELHLPLPVVVVDNGGYGEIRNEMADRGEAVHAVALGSPDFPMLARALGCHGVALQRAEQLTDEVGKALAADRPTLLHIRESSRAAVHPSDPSRRP